MIRHLNFSSNYLTKNCCEYEINNGEPVRFIIACIDLTWFHYFVDTNIRSYNSDSRAEDWHIMALGSIPASAKSKLLSSVILNPYTHCLEREAVIAPLKGVGLDILLKKDLVISCSELLHL